MDSQNDQIVLIFVSSAVFILLLAVLVVLFLLIYQKRIVSQENRLQKLENERQQMLLKATIEGQERERKRLAKELHDGIGSLLSGLSLNLKFQKNQEVGNSAQGEFLTEACAMVDDSITHVRRMSHNLMPVTLENFGLVSAISECIQPVRKMSELTVEFKAPEERFDANDDIELGVLRVVQELVQNTIKHAEANKIKLELTCSNHELCLVYHDNGIGFEMDAVNKSHGIGLKGIESRVLNLGGTLNIKSEPGKGVDVAVQIPI